MAISTPGQDARIRSVAGTEGDDRIVVETGTIAVGNGGKDVFVIAAAAAGAESLRLGAITDFGDGDSLDLSQLGANVAILGEGRMTDGSTRLSIDFNGDGQEDGYLYVGGAGFIPADDNFASPMPIIEDGEMHILPFPMPGDGEVIGGPANDGEVTILPWPLPGKAGAFVETDDGVFTIQPYPMPGDDGVVTILPFPLPGDGPVTEGEFHILPFPMPGDGVIEDGEFHILPVDLNSAVGNSGGVKIAHVNLSQYDFLALMAA
ncbi:MAG: hypothetical protein ABW063_16405 [Caulobacter sp.]